MVRIKSTAAQHRCGSVCLMKRDASTLQWKRKRGLWCVNGKYMKWVWSHWMRKTWSCHCWKSTSIAVQSGQKHCHFARSAIMAAQQKDQARLCERGTSLIIHQKARALLRGSEHKKCLTKGSTKGAFALGAAVHAWVVYIELKRLLIVKSEL